ncbi:hypothetical protein C4D60_Mb11t23680 [Musa balbisiana]|uniref:Uncharacterized protein n=1 Tax=Musa balbisiana TaxID=52838 RepID=A0A4S8J6C5_MUSBA|nr:hypothetical protein C4D60_Mb11t23680 [Musa balbisiana]
MFSQGVHASLPAVVSARGNIISGSFGADSARLTSTAEASYHMTEHGPLLADAVRLDPRELWARLGKTTDIGGQLPEAQEEDQVSCWFELLDACSEKPKCPI